MKSVPVSLSDLLLYNHSLFNSKQPLIMEPHSFPGDLELPPVLLSDAPMKFFAPVVWEIV